MNRRDFLNPRRLAKAAAEIADAVQELQTLIAEPIVEDPEMALLRFSRQAMATTFEVILPLGTENALAAAEAALDEIDRLEDQLTVFRDHSEVSQLNRRAAEEAVVVEPGLFSLLGQAQQLFHDTDGAFDMTAGALTKAWGFFRRSGQVPGEEELQAALQRVGMQHVILDEQQMSVRFLRPGLEINLGSIGKGYALDRAARLLRDQFGVISGLLHGGKSSVYALGSPPGKRDGWPVAIRHPWDAEKQLGIVRLRDQGLATSAATFQNLEHDGKKLGHIIDPRTGWPADGMASATVVAATAAEADALATAFFIMGVEEAKAYCNAHNQVGTVLLPAEQAHPVLLGLSAGEFGLSSGNVTANPKQ